MLNTNRRQRGFSLVELALGLVIVATLLSALLVPLATQLDQRRTGETQRLLEVAREALYGFVVAQDRFPCPATAAGNGREAFIPPLTELDGPVSGRCLGFRGFLPAVTLGLSPLDREGFQPDAFGGDANRIRYAVADVDFDPSAKLYTATGKMRSLGMTVVSNATNRLSVCSAANTAASGCPAGSVTLANGNAIAVVLSVGKNPDSRGDDENENLDVTGTNQVFVSRIQSDAALNPFDDMLLWVSPNVLISRLAAAGKLP
jgi:prepilin-type N-terminal cleavage/methylation domain-containing protein